MKDLINKPFAHFETVILNENTKLEDTETEIEGEEEDTFDGNAPKPKQTIAAKEVEFIEAEIQKILQMRMPLPLKTLLRLLRKQLLKNLHLLLKLQRKRYKL